ncbi:MAG TPA: hypothetical protein HPP77_10860 [Candidatus Hydrogenedentes bacterium]|nr:hypothetical protein [Candidatus Hydrogenedentota bacterium]
MYGEATLADAARFIFPYHDFLSFSRSAITPWFIAFILAYFFLSLAYLFRRVQRFERALARHIEGPSLEKIEADALLQEFASEYKRSFLATAGQRRKTDIDAADVFDERSVLGKYVNVRYWMAVPGTLLSLGIFGTFLGLTLGITGFDTSNIESIQGSIRTLLGGMGTAFLTSLWGMAASLAFSVLEKGLFNRAAQRLRAFCRALNRRYRATRAELHRFDREDRERSLRQLFVSEIDGIETSTASLLKAMLSISAQQTTALELFAEVLADRIRVSTERLELRGRIKATIEETRRAGISQDELDGFLEDLVRTCEERGHEQDDAPTDPEIADDGRSI